ncbi:Protein FAM54A [Habropoda laboriosa]|uniref:Protein FAM54A n=2 Tax=Habropoda laboriosa TaxID=597456 RepID=A0A0L7RJZ8_9HYME|nr:Protein FAM54A [Habropoda laboriosa]
MNEPPKYYGKRRSIVRRIGSMLPLKPPPKIYVSVTPLHSMTSSMINEESNGDCTDINGYGPARLSNVRPDLLEPISFGSEVRLLALEQELQELREQVSAIVKNNKQSRYTSTASLANGTDSENTTQLQQPPPPRPPPPPPLPLPLLPLPPPTPHIARRASLQDHKVEERKRGPFASQASMIDVFKDIDNVKLKPIARSPGGRPLRVRRDNSPCNDLQEILRRRYVAMNSADSKNSVNLTIDDSSDA